MKKVLIIGGTGTVGSQVVKELLKKGQQVRVLTTSKEKCAALPKGVEGVLGDLAQPASLPTAFEGVDKVFMVNAHSQTELTQAGNAIAAAKRAGVQKLVYQSIHRAHEYQVIPHVATKVQVEELVQQSGLNYTFVCPNNFFQNDFWFKDAILQYGIYPQPIGDLGMNRIDVRDIAEVAVTAMFSQEYDGQSIPLAGPDILNGADTARILSEEIGIQVNYAGNDLVPWAEQTRQIMPDWIVDDWTIMYSQFQLRGAVATEQELELLTKVLGSVPRSYASFVKEHIPFFQPAPSLV
ncbi:SDR family oxidoreductase [Telluribacter sp. SYSU D00476]|uniref:SDR family oxidoreductase n=1 Tax=Telluribacter sp. SYSU D00476 TaxID=2811430 RepID=UPI001FF18C66|nr:NmrA family NAD(P)-binding protein [Telluribacter sp. SYSU D00476]